MPTRALNHQAVRSSDGLVLHIKVENRFKVFRPQRPLIIRLPHKSDTSFCYPLRNFGRNQLLDGSISLSPPIPKFDDRFARQNRYEPPPEFLWLHLFRHSSPSFGSQHTRSTADAITVGLSGRRCPPLPKVPTFTSLRARVFHPNTSRACLDFPWSVFSRRAFKGHYASILSTRRGRKSPDTRACRASSIPTVDTDEGHNTPRRVPRFPTFVRRPKIDAGPSNQEVHRASDRKAESRTTQLMRKKSPVRRTVN